MDILDLRKWTFSTFDSRPSKMDILDLRKWTFSTFDSRPSKMDILDLRKWTFSTFENGHVFRSQGPQFNKNGHSNCQLEMWIHAKTLISRSCVNARTLGRPRVHRDLQFGPVATIGGSRGAEIEQKHEKDEMSVVGAGMLDPG